MDAPEMSLPSSFDFVAEVRRCYALAKPVFDRAPERGKISEEDLLTLKIALKQLKYSISLEAANHRIVVADTERRSEAQDPSLIGSGPERDEHEQVDFELILEAFNQYKRNLPKVSLRPLRPYQEETVKQLQELVQMLNVHLHLGTLDWKLRKLPGFIMGLVAAGQTLANFDGKLFLDEETRTQEQKVLVRGDEPWIYRLNAQTTLPRLPGDCFETAWQRLRALTFGLCDVLDLHGRFDEKASGAFLTGSMIAAAVCWHPHRASTKIFSPAELLSFYPATYSVLERLLQKGQEVPPSNKSLRKLLSEVETGVTVQLLPQNADRKYPLPGDRALLRVESHSPPLPGEVPLVQAEFKLVPGADIDLMICGPQYNFDEEARRQFELVRAVYPEAVLRRLERPKTYTWNIENIPRAIQMYWTEFPGLVAQHHVAPARGFFRLDEQDRPVFHVMPSLARAAVDMCIRDMRYVVGRLNPAEILGKYYDRWFTADIYKGDRLVELSNEYLAAQGQNRAGVRLLPCLGSKNFDILCLPQELEISGRSRPGLKLGQKSFKTKRAPLQLPEPAAAPQPVPLPESASKPAAAATFRAPDSDQVQYDPTVLQQMFQRQSP